MRKIVAIMFLSLLLWVMLLIAVTGGSSWLASADAAVMQTVYAMRNPAATVVFRGITWLGSPLVYVVVLAAGMAISRSRGWLYLVLALGSLAAAQLLRVAINLAVHRPRPPHSHWLVNANFYAFPSGHTLAAAVGFGLAAWLVWLADRRMGLGLAGIAAAVVILVGWSRVYLGVHWPSDVLGSWLLAAFWLAGTILVASRLAH
jgi:membrane-associated phospholipid phosphatase